MQLSQGRVASAGCGPVCRSHTSRNTRRGGSACSGRLAVRAKDDSSNDASGRRRAQVGS